MNYEYEIRYAIIDEREHYYLDSYYPNNLPKMTKLMIDGKALYIHRANFQIIDKELLD